MRRQPLNEQTVISPARLDRWRREPVLVMLAELRKWERSRKRDSSREASS